MSPLDRVLSRCIETDSGCWEFQGCRLDRGYGRASWNGRLWLTHRMVYVLMIGRIPEETEIDHLCKNKPCCNPWHLEPVTRSENIRRGPQGEIRAAFERAKAYCPAGHPYSTENTYISPKGHRYCRTCKREALQRYTESNREVIAERQRRLRSRKKRESAA